MAYSREPFQGSIPIVCELSAVLRDRCDLGELSLFSRGGAAEREPQNHTHT